MMNIVKGFFFIITLIAITACNPKQSTSTGDASEKTEDLSKYGIAESPTNALGGLDIGDMAPIISANDQDGNPIVLSELLEKGSVVLIFYRGYWCPKCTRYLEAFEGELHKITDKGASVVAVSPETNEFAKKTIEDTGISIPVISDSDRSIMEAYKLSFKVTEAYDKKINTFLNKDIATTNGAEESYLPIPATYIIGQDGKIKWRFYDPDYAKRASVEEIVANL